MKEGNIATQNLRRLEVPQINNKNMNNIVKHFNAKNDAHEVINLDWIKPHDVLVLTKYEKNRTGLDLVVEVLTSFFPRDIISYESLSNYLENVNQVNTGRKRLVIYLSLTTTYLDDQDLLLFKAATNNEFKLVWITPADTAKRNMTKILEPEKCLPFSAIDFSFTAFHLRPAIVRLKRNVKFLSDSIKTELLH